MDEQGVEATWLYPSQGVVLEPSMHHRPARRRSTPTARSTGGSTSSGASRTSDRIFGVPYLILSDPERLAAELRWCLDHGARVVAIRHGAAVTADGLRSPADPIFDRFWGFAQESGVVVSSHDGADATYAEMGTRCSTGCGEGPTTRRTPPAPATTCG